MGQPFRLRPASRADLPALTALEELAFSDPWTARQLGEAFTWTGALALVAEDDEGIVGYVLGRSVVDEGEILSIASTPAQRRAGIGRALLDAATSELARRGVHSIWLEVRVSNEAARALYGRAGFTSSAVRRDYYRDPVEDALVLHLRLPAEPGSALRSPVP
jgi:ribosomal-protein-alanine N-acetyltransferase